MALGVFFNNNNSKHALKLPNEYIEKKKRIQDANLMKSIAAWGRHTKLVDRWRTECGGKERINSVLLVATVGVPKTSVPNFISIFTVMCAKWNGIENEQNVKRSIVIYKRCYHHMHRMSHPKRERKWTRDTFCQTTKIFFFLFVLFFSWCFCYSLFMVEIFLLCHHVVVKIWIDGDAKLDEYKAKILNYKYSECEEPRWKKNEEKRKNRGRERARKRVWNKHLEK